MKEQKTQHNPQCQKSGSFQEHLCYIVSQRFHLSDSQEYKNLTSEPKFKCQHCGRVANSDKNLCEPVKL